MSVPIVELAEPVPELLAQYSAGTWKSPVKTPVSAPVSTRVNPDSAKPSVPETAVLQVVLLFVEDDSNHSSSSNVISRILA
jgi:hypothetical protein